MKRQIKLWTGIGDCMLAQSLGTEAIAAGLNSSTTTNPGIESAGQEYLLTDAAGGEGGEGGDSSSDFQDRLSGAALLSALRSGGYVIYFRHAQTDADYADQASATLDLNDCSTQRTLSQVGWQQARAIGQSFQSLQIPVAQVYSSEYCRAWQTADLAFGRFQKTSALNFPPSEEYTDAQVQQMRNAVMPLLTAVPAQGTNTVIVGHDDIFDAATGIYPEPQGVAYVLRPNGQGGFDILANMTATEWAELPGS